MPVAQVGTATSAAGTGANSFTVTSPGTLVSTDYVVIVLYHDAATTIGASASGFTVVYSDVESTNQNMAVEVLVGTGFTGSGGFTVTTALGAGAWIARTCSAWSGVGSYVVGTSYSTSPGGANFNIPSITMGQPGVVLAVGGQAFVSGSGRTFTPTFTAVANINENTHWSRSYSAGATGVVTVTNSAFGSASFILLGLEETPPSPAITATAVGAAANAGARVSARPDKPSSTVSLADFAWAVRPTVSNNELTQGGALTGSANWSAGVQTNGNTGYASWARTSALASLSNEFTLVVVADPTTSGTNGYWRGLLSVPAYWSGGHTSPFHTLALLANDTGVNNNLILNMGNAGAWTFANAHNLASDPQTCYAIRRNGSSAQALKDGVVVGNRTDISGSVSWAGQTPAVQTSSTGSQTTAATSTSVTYPTGITAGDLLVFMGAVPADITSTLTGFTAQSSGATAGALELFVFTRVATGAESGTITWDFGGTSTVASWAMLRISNAEAVENATYGNATGTTAVNPPSVTASWGAGNNMFIGVGAYEDGNISMSAGSGNLDGDTNVRTSTTAPGVGLVYGHTVQNTATFDPFSFTLSSATRRINTTLVLRPKQLPGDVTVGSRSRTDPGEGQTGTYYFVGIANRWLSDAELLSITQNPLDFESFSATAATAAGTAHNALVREQPPSSALGTDVMLLESRWGKRLEDGSYYLLESGTASGSTNDFTFTGADGASWGPGWTFVQGTGDILTNRGRMVTGTGAFDGRSAIYNTGNSNVVFQIDTEIPTNDAQFPEIRFRYNNTTGDGLLLIFEPHNDIAQLFPYAAFVRGSQIGSNISFAVAAGDIIHTKIMSVGNDHYVRLWKNTDPEPGTWSRVFTDATGAGNTHIMVRTVTSNAGVAVTNYWDNFSFAPASVASASTATSTGTASNAAPAVLSNAGQATGSGAANSATPRVGPNAGLATGAGVAPDASERISPVATTAAATGVANNATASTSSSTNASAGQAAASGQAFDATTRVTSAADLATATGTANGPSELVRPVATHATATGAGQDAVSTLRVNAALATATGTGHNPAPRVAPAATTATATGVANDAAVSYANLALAQLATATGTAFDATARVVTNVALATATATAQAAIATLRANATNGTAAGVAHDATARVTTNATTATATGTANAAASSLRAPSATATATGSADTANERIAPVAVTATATGVANDASVVAGNDDIAPADPATATGTAHAATTNVVARGSTHAAATAAAQDTDAALRLNATLATAAGVAHNASVTTVVPAFANATSATATGAAFNASVRIVSNPSAATATGTGVGPSERIAPRASEATATGVAQNSTPRVRITPVHATATGAALAPALRVVVTSTLATALATGFDPSSRIIIRPSIAIATGVAYDAEAIDGIRSVAPATLASATGTAFNASTRVRVFNPGTAQATGVAWNTSGGQRTARATVATATGVAQSSAPRVGPRPSSASAIAQGMLPATILVRSGSITATGTGAAFEVRFALTVMDDLPTFGWGDRVVISTYRDSGDPRVAQSSPSQQRVTITEVGSGEDQVTIDHVT